MRIGIVVPHIFMHDTILPDVIFSPGELALQLANSLQELGHEVTLFSPGRVDTKVKNITADLSLFEEELSRRGDTYLSLLKKHPFTFITLARQVQSEVIARVYKMANEDKLDIVHIYTNEEDIALPFEALCSKPVVFTHHDPYNFLVKYKSVFPKYKNLSWISISFAQRSGMPTDTNWVGNVYHGLPKNQYKPVYKTKGNYVVFLGRIIEPKGLHLAIGAVKKHNKSAQVKLDLKIAGKHYADHKKDNYWQQKILPELNDQHIEYLGFIKDTVQKQELIGGATALIIPSTFDEPFGMVMIEALACGTPVIGLNSGAIPEVINEGITGFVITKSDSPKKTINGLSVALAKRDRLDRKDCRLEFEKRFTLKRMAQDHAKIYEKLVRE
jgi:glycosyltransferase involved in cell wall biosynthesis